MNDNVPPKKIDLSKISFDLDLGGLYQTEPLKPKVIKVGLPCPVCGIGIMDYNGVLDLECPVCGHTEGPGGGCT